MATKSHGYSINLINDSFIIISVFILTLIVIITNLSEYVYAINAVIIIITAVIIAIVKTFASSLFTKIIG